MIISFPVSSLFIRPTFAQELGISREPPVKNTPLGLALTAGRTEYSFNPDSETATWFWSLRLAGIGRSGFTTGIALQSDYFDNPTQNDRVQSFKISFDFRYFY